jgi:hypothetical protein
MKKIFIAILVFSLCAVYGIPAFAEMPGPDAASLWNYITKESPYKDWGFWPDHQGMQPGRAPHGPLHKVFVNDKALGSRKAPVQFGAIEVKESYNKDRELKAITVMYKIRDYNPDGGDWFWAKYGPDGKADAAGKLQGCIGCHGSGAKNDYILVHEFK